MAPLKPIIRLRREKRIQRTIEEARRWPQFNENEKEITTALRGNNRLSLEAAYRQIVLPKLGASRDQMRKDVLAEIQKAPPTTATRTTATKPMAGPVGEQSIVDIVRAAADGIR